jgi:hypothetical protein
LWRDSLSDLVQAGINLGGLRFRGDLRLGWRRLRQRAKDQRQ